nr:Rv3235 family protein [Streptomyces roseirectus]
MTRTQNRRTTAPGTPGTPGGRPPGTAGRTLTAAPPSGRPPAARPTSRTRPTDNRPASRVPAQTPRRPVAPPQPHPADLFADRLLAVLSGRHPVHSMLRHTVGRAYDDLARLAEHGPLSTVRGTTPVLRDIGYEIPRPGALEVFARFTTGPRLRAMAFRLELSPDRRWRCTAVELDGPTGRPPRTP